MQQPLENDFLVPPRWRRFIVSHPDPDSGDMFSAIDWTRTTDGLLRACIPHTLVDSFLQSERRRGGCQLRLRKAFSNQNDEVSPSCYPRVRQEYTCEFTKEAHKDRKRRRQGGMLEVVKMKNGLTAADEEEAEGQKADRSRKYRVSKGDRKLAKACAECAYRCYIVQYKGSSKAFITLTNDGAHSPGVGQPICHGMNCANPAFRHTSQVQYDTERADPTSGIRVNRRAEKHAISAVLGAIEEEQQLVQLGKSIQEVVQILPRSDGYHDAQVVSNSVTHRLLAFDRDFACCDCAEGLKQSLCKHHVMALKVLCDHVDEHCFHEKVIQMAGTWLGVSLGCVEGGAGGMLPLLRELQLKDDVGNSPGAHTEATQHEEPAGGTSGLDNPTSLPTAHPHSEFEADGYGIGPNLAVTEAIRRSVNVPGGARAGPSWHQAAEDISQDFEAMIKSACEAHVPEYIRTEVFTEASHVIKKLSSVINSVPVDCGEDAPNSVLDTDNTRRVEKGGSSAMSRGIELQHTRSDLVQHCLPQIPHQLSSFATSSQRLGALQAGTGHRQAVGEADREKPETGEDVVLQEDASQPLVAETGNTEPEAPKPAPDDQLLSQEALWMLLLLLQSQNSSQYPPSAASTSSDEGHIVQLVETLQQLSNTCNKPE